MTQSFQPHQLDFDWRFDADSQRQIAWAASCAESIVLLGCPSLMSILSSQIKMGTLVERNPNHVSVAPFSRHCCDLRMRNDAPRFSSMFDLAIVDAPWYPDDLLAWIDVALSAIEVGKDVLFVLWPKNIRPSAQLEHEKIQIVLENIGELRQVGVVTYDTPIFEQISLKAANQTPLRRAGLLMRLTKRRSITLARDLNCGPGIWKRFSVGKGQVAIKIEPAADNESRAIEFEEMPHVLHSTSRRDCALSNVNIWTSENVVGRLKNPTSVAFGLAHRLTSHMHFVEEMFTESWLNTEDVKVKTWQHLE